MELISNILNWLHIGIDRFIESMYVRNTLNARVYSTFCFTIALFLYLPECLLPSDLFFLTSCILHPNALPRTLLRHTSQHFFLCSSPKPYNWFDLQALNFSHHCSLWNTLAISLLSISYICYYISNLPLYFIAGPCNYLLFFFSSSYRQFLRIFSLLYKFFYNATFSKLELHFIPVYLLVQDKIWSKASSLNNFENYIYSKIISVILLLFDGY